MEQKRVLVVGAILVAAGIGAPTTAMLTQGGALPESATPAVEATTPAPPEPAYVPIEVTPPTDLPPLPPAPVPRPEGAERQVPSHLGEEPAPPRGAGAGAPPAEAPAAPSPADTVPAPEPAPQDPEPVPQAPTFPTFEPDPGDQDDPPLQPPAFPSFEPDPGDQ
jgi:hypothetical protein